MKWKIDRNPTCKCNLTLNICGIVTMWTLSSQYVIFRSFESDGESNEKKCLRENISRMKCWITLSHKVSGGRLWLYVVAETFGYTSRCVVVVLLAAYRINAPTNRPAIIKKNHFHHILTSHFVFVGKCLVLFYFTWKIWNDIIFMYDAALNIKSPL